MPPIFNELGQTSYAARQPIGLEGQPGAGMKARTFVNPILNQIQNVAIGGTPTDGIYRIRVVEPDGTFHDIVFTASSSTNAQIETGLIANTPPSLAGVAVVTAGAGTSVDIATVDPFTSLTLQLTAPAPGTLTATTTQAQGGALLDIGIAHLAGTTLVDGLPTVALTNGTSDELLVTGITARSRIYLNQGIVPPAVDQIGRPELVTSAYEGEIYVRNRGAVASAPDGLVFFVVNAAGGQRLGQLRADDDGANSIPFRRDRCKWIDRVPPEGIGRVYLRL